MTLIKRLKRTKFYDVFGGFVKFRVRAFLHFFRRPWLRIKNLWQENHIKYPHFLSAVAIIKNEAPYLKEWIEYHRLVGVEKFYLYDNESTDNTKDVLAPYIKSGVVEYIYYPGDAMQRKAYNDCLKKYHLESKWLGIFDLDEFIVPVSTKTIPEFLKTMPHGTSQLLISWLLFGSSGHKTMPAGGVLESYKNRAPESHPRYKAIVNPRRTYAAGVHGHVVFGQTIDELGEPMLRMSAKMNPAKKDQIRVHHYAVKSFEEYTLRQTRGSARSGKRKQRYHPEYFNHHDRNEVYDPIMDKWIDQLKNV
ncbi:MAG: glycosyltransferase family 92 protein [Rickettsiales bacterium]|jgi:hypothetical protein|nr:glycosyltransferase family 92 protein [Rickettsiales bacterium]